jgi:hypothetical protein
MKYLIIGKFYEPIKCGDEKDWYESATSENTMCGDCGCKVGQQHIMGCDIERCPACNMQLITCDCHPIYQVTKEQQKDKDYMRKIIAVQQVNRKELQKEFVSLKKQKKNQEEME